MTFKLKIKWMAFGYTFEYEYEGAFRDFKRVLKYCERIYANVVEKCELPVPPCMQDTNVEVAEARIRREDSDAEVV